jgi:predicted O-methyltransferase YrrM
VLELGRAGGGTLFLWTRAAASRATLISLGLPPWELDDPGEAARREVLATFGRRRQRVQILREDPLRAEARAEIEALLEGRGVDFLFLTGEDAPDRIRACLESYAPLVRPGGLVALDGVRQRLGGSDDVPRLWGAVRARARTRTLVEDESRAGFGIGVVHVDAETWRAWSRLPAA